MDNFSHSPRINLHNHTLFSDGSHSVSSIIEQGIKSGIKLLGICDHVGTMKTASLDFASISRYGQVIRTISEKYKYQIQILIGIEIDFCNTRTPELSNLPYDQINRLDYILFEYVNNPYWNGLHLKELCSIRRKFGIPVGLAHPDISILCDEMPAIQVLDFLETNSIFLELSTKQPSSYRKFPDFFNKLREKKVFLSIGSDTHAVLEDVNSIDDALNFIKNFKLQDHLVSRLFF